ncbi:IS3 family transposase [Trueperella pyogenes]|uniref:IS3 family transposase n=1 Tax=Trueperella pyogenes TaxID=1661 RepID=UPI00126960EE|nr:IS3 family transposase [Trueperella pyogenes]
MPDDVDELRALAARLMVEKAVLEQRIEIMGKDPGSIPRQLPNHLKATIVETLRDTFPLTVLLDVLELKASSYYYHRTVASMADKYEQLRDLVRHIAQENHYAYGSRRIWFALRHQGKKVSEKVVRRLMKEEQIPVYYARKKRRYSSYKGEASPAPRDLVQRDFLAALPNQIRLTDVSEFAGPEGKVYFSLIINCFDGKVVAYRYQRNAHKTLTQGMLEEAISYLSQHEHTRGEIILHSDRGGHYRCKDWISRTAQAGIKRSMSRKGCSPDNARCEGFFGTMKNEMFYGRQWKSVSEIEQAIDQYIDWYNNTRIKTELGGLTIAAYCEKTLEYKTV